MKAGNPIKQLFRVHIKETMDFMSPRCDARSIIRN
jgi:hypothetical protein